MNFLASKKQLRASFLRWSLFTVPLIVLLGFMSGQLGSPNTAWFAGLEKPAIFPPPYLFGIVWTVLYIMIGLSVALVASAWGAAGRGVALIMFEKSSSISRRPRKKSFWSSAIANLIILVSFRSAEGLPIYFG